MPDSFRHFPITSVFWRSLSRDVAAVAAVLRSIGFDIVVPAIPDAAIIAAFVTVFPAFLTASFLSPFGTFQ